ncbi:MAG: Flp pilus assembly protein CpaB [Candidatus Omnitrophota bacterium]|nr:Flp pilus assembly protein CpaB [Candidatus Omnitrophota bacterium]
MDKRIINLIVGVLFALIALLIINRYIAEQRRELEELRRKGEIVDVVVAKDDIARETTITADMVKMKPVSVKTLLPGDLTSVESAIGKFAIADILKDQHVNSDSVKPLVSFRYLSELVPQGYRAITIAVDKLSATEGLIKPQDKVDIVGVFSFPAGGGMNAPIVITLFQNIKVLAMDKNISPYRVEGRANTVTLALKPEDIKMLTYALELGKVRLTLRTPLDTSEDFEYSALTLDGLLNKLGMVQQRVEQPKPPTVDVYRGSKQEEKPL